MVAFTKTETINRYIASGHILSVRENDKIKCQRTDHGARCYCDDVRIAKKAKKKKKRPRGDGDVDALCKVSTSAWSEFMQTGRKATAMSTTGIERSMITSEDPPVVFSGETQILNASEALTKLRENSETAKSNAQRQHTSARHLAHAAKELGLVATDHPGPERLRNAVLAAEAALFKRRKLLPLKGADPRRTPTADRSEWPPEPSKNQRGG